MLIHLMQVETFWHVYADDKTVISDQLTWVPAKGCE